MGEIRKSKYNSTSILPHTDNTNKYKVSTKTNNATENIIKDNILRYDETFQFLFMKMQSFFIYSASVACRSADFNLSQKVLSGSKV